MSPVVNHNPPYDTEEEFLEDWREFDYTDTQEEIIDLLLEKEEEYNRTDMREEIDKVWNKNTEDPFAELLDQEFLFERRGFGAKYQGRSKVYGLNIQEYIDKYAL